MRRRRYDILLPTTYNDGRPVDADLLEQTWDDLAEHFGGRAAYAGKVGRDELGEFFLKDMRAAGVAIDVRGADAPTGACAILITDDAQRTMLTCLGASATLAPGTMRVAVAAMSLARR